MGQFSASLKVPGDRSSLDATLLIEEGRLQIKAGDQPIGDWSLQEIDLNRLDGGYRMTAEGEQLFIEVADLTAFDAAVDENTRRRRFARKGAPKLPKKKPVEAQKAEPLPVSPVKPKVVEKTDETAESTGNPVMTFVDGLVERAEKRFGSLLPSWVFTRWTVLAIVLALLTAIFLPALIANILLFGGLAVVVFGAVLYTDDRMSAKILPGRSTPTHVLISGVGLLMVGVLLGVIGG